jgi:glycosyltransferase involved in cell wall biosynthesis
MKYDISIIIPVYNREKLIKNALNSVLKQTIADKLEIICVDDGSTDNTVEVIKDYQKKYKNIFLYQQKNSGPGVARNLGIDNAHGEYVIFLDSDDWAPERAYELMYNYAKEKDADVIIGKMLRKIKGTMNNQWYVIKTMQDIFDEFKEINCAKEYKIPLTMPGPVTKMSRTSMLRDNNIKFPNERMGEDLIFSLELFKHANTVYLLDEIIYMYESDLSDGDSLVSRIDPTTVLSGMNSMLKSFMYLKDEKNEIYYETIHFFSSVKYVIDRFWKLEETKEKEEIFEKIKEYFSLFKGRKELYIPIQYLMKIDLDTLLLLPYKAYKLQIELLEKMNPVRLQQVEKYVDRWKSNGNAERELAQVRNSLSFRIGSAIMWLPCKIRDLIKGKK